MRVGITAYAQEALGDIVFVTLPAVGTALDAGQALGEVESTKSVSDVYAPVAGTVRARNEALDANPELVNADPYGEGWLLELEPSRARTRCPATPCSTPPPTRRCCPDRGRRPRPEVESRAQGPVDPCVSAPLRFAAAPGAPPLTWGRAGDRRSPVGHRSTGGGTSVLHAVRTAEPRRQPLLRALRRGRGAGPRRESGRPGQQQRDRHHVHDLASARSRARSLAGGRSARRATRCSRSSPPAGTALLVVKRGPNAGSRFLLDADVTTAGRHPESDIFLDDVTVSRRHAEFVREGNGFIVRDVGSLNGTYLDRERIESVGLAGGDEVQIGKYRLVFLAGPRRGEST